MVHFNWLQFLVGPSDTALIGVHTATFVLAFFVVLLLSYLARRSLRGASQEPARMLSLRGVFELLIEFIVSLIDTVIGPKGRKYTALFAAVFLFVFVNNIIGLVPGMTPSTDNLNTTIALGLFIFIAYNWEGFREHGLSYLKQFLGPTGNRILAPINLLVLIMLPIELVSHLARPMSLGLRLQGNMMGDHTVLGVFLDLTHFIIPVIFYFLGLFVCFMQAFVFTILSMVYISMAISHDH